VFRGDDSTIFRAIDAIKHHLLYCHSVALEDPLQHLLYGDENLPPSALAGMRGGTLGFRVNGGPLFRRYLILLSYLRPLIESGVVILVEDHWGVIRRPVQLPPEELQSLIQGLDVDTAGYFPGRPDDEETQRDAKASMIGSCLEYLNFVSRVRQRSDHGVDLFLEEPTYRSVFRHIQLRCAELAPPQDREYDMILLDYLLQLRLPRLEELSETDIKTIREEGSFAEWREALKLALDRFHRMSVTGLPEQDRSEQLRVEIADTLDPQREKLQKEVEGSSFLRKARGGVLDMTVGLGVDVLLGTMGAVTTAAIAKQGFMAVYKAYRESQHGIDKARQSHYLLFEDSARA